MIMEADAEAQLREFWRLNTEAQLQKNILKPDDEGHL